MLHNYEFKRWHKALIHTAGLIGLALHVVGTFKGYENVPSVLYATSVFVFLKDAGRWVMEQERLASFVNVVGRYAFEIYLLQFILLDAATRIPEIDRNSLVYRLGAPLVMIPVIIAFTWCLRKIPVVRRIVP